MHTLHTTTFCTIMVTYVALCSLCLTPSNASCSSHKVRLPSKELDQLVRATDSYSGSDMAALCREAAMGPIRDLGPAVASVALDKIRAINLHDFVQALQVIKPSVNLAQLESFQAFTRDYGTS
jgi:SpoVK/Ycf46/Vps4 family AAA+-type ATPase